MTVDCDAAPQLSGGATEPMPFDVARAQQQSIEHVLRPVLRTLGMADAAAVDAARGFSADQFTISVTTLPLPAPVPASHWPWMISLVTPHTVAELPAALMTTQLAAAPTLVLFNCAVGCDQQGRLGLFRRIDRSDCNAEGLETALRHVIYMARLLWADGEAVMGVRP